MAHRLSCSVACGIFPDQGSNPCPPALAGGFLTTAPPRKPSLSYLKSYSLYKINFSTQQVHFCMIVSTLKTSPLSCLLMFTIFPRIEACKNKLLQSALSILAYFRQWGNGSSLWRMTPPLLSSVTVSQCNVAALFREDKTPESESLMQPESLFPTAKPFATC